MVYLIQLHIDGMHCGMCESHVNNTIRNMFDTKKVSSSASKGITTILCSRKIPEKDLRDVLDPTGYRITDYACSLYETDHFWQRHNLLKKQTLKHPKQKKRNKI